MESLVLQTKNALDRPMVSGEGAFVTVVIVNWNSGTMLRACLRTVTRENGGLQIRIIVIDNKSKDGSAELVDREFSEATLLRSGANLGFGRGNNLAQQYSSPGYVLFLNPDTELRENALRRMVGFLAAHPDAGAVGCRMVFPDGEVADQNLQWFPSPLKEFVRLAFLSEGVIRLLKGVLPWNDPTKSGYVDKLYGGCLMVRSSVLDRIGWFDERFFMYGEDVDLSRRIREAGWKLYYLSEAEVMHAKGGVTKGASSQFSILMSCESMAKLIEKYQGRAAGFRYRLAVVAASLIRLGLLIPFRLLSVARASNCKGKYREAMASCLLRIQWAWGLRKASTPV
jgi:GT2 family glycosyltransferase